jgi:predicted hydrolase (HD superfamily)
MEPIEIIYTFVETAGLPSKCLNTEATLRAIIARLNEISEMMNKKKLTLDEYVEKNIT